MLKGLSVNIVKAPNTFFTVSWAAKANAIPPIPRVPNNAPILTPILLKAITRPIIHTMTSIVRLIMGIILLFCPSDCRPQ